MDKPTAADLYTIMVRAFVPPLPGDEMTREERREYLDGVALRIAAVPLRKLSDRIPKKRDPERLPTLQQVIVAAFSHRWGASVVTVRAFIEDNPNRHRRPTPRFAKFFEDLAQFGRAEFNREGNIIKRSLGRGPDAIEFFSYTKGGADAPPRRRRAA